MNTNGQDGQVNLQNVQTVAPQFSQEMFERFVVAMIGEEGVAIVGEKDGWKEFSPYDEALISFWKRGLELLRDNIDIKAITELYKDFDYQTKTFLRQASVVHDAAGNPVSFETMFGEIKSVRPEWMPFLLGKILVLYVIERKLNTHLRKETGRLAEVEQLQIRAV